MQPDQEMSKMYWRHGTTVHMRIFELPECRAVQWWHATRSGVIYLARDDAFDPHFDGTILTCERSLEHHAELPPIPAPVDTAQFHRDIQACRPQMAARALAHVKRAQDMIALTDSTSGNELERKLALHRAKTKLQAVARFKI